MTRRVRSIDGEEVAVASAAHSERSSGSESDDSSAYSPPPAKRTRAQTHSGATSPSPSAKPPRRSPSASSSPMSSFTAPLSPPPLPLPVLPVPAEFADSFDCHPTLSALTDYFTHHHSAVARAVARQSEHLHAALEKQRRLCDVLRPLSADKQRAERAAKQLTKDAAQREKRVAELEGRIGALEASVSKGEEAGKELERVRRELVKERRERKEAEEREKTAAANTADCEKRLKAAERRLTIADKKAKKLEDAESQTAQQLLELQRKLAQQPPPPSSSSSSSAPSSAEVAALQLKLSFYESGPSSLHALSLRDLSALGSSLQQSLDAVKEEQERRKECKLCLQDVASVVFLPCSHMISCIKCSDTVVKNDCPVCRAPIEHRIHTKS